MSGLEWIRRYMPRRVTVVLLAISGLLYAMLIFSFFRFVSISSPWHPPDAQHSVELVGGRLQFARREWPDTPARFRDVVAVGESSFIGPNFYQHITTKCFEPKPGWIFEQVDFGIRCTGVSFGLFPIAMFVGCVPVLLFVKRRYFKSNRTDE